jgi:hypothetical protein
MEKPFIKYPSIEQFRTIVKNVQYAATFIGLDENEKPIYDKAIKLPTIQCVATEKVHGTNAAVCFNSQTGFYVQSRKNIITPEKDNASCAFFAEQNRKAWMSIIHLLAEEHNIDLFNNIITVYYEWAGGNIQKNSALSGLDKKAIIFRYFKATPLDKEQPTYWRETKIGYIADEFPFWAASHSAGIYNIMNSKTWEFEIDFETPQLSQNSMIELVDKIESNSPLGQSFGKENNIGEGIVVEFIYKDVRHAFKVKGEKHAGKSKVKTLTPVDEEKEKAKIDFVNNYACKEWRLQQMYQETFDTLNGGKGDITKTGDFLRAVINDVMKEEADILIEMGLDPKEVNGMISKVARTWFMTQLDSEIM